MLAKLRAKQPVTVVSLGDSITYGVGIGDASRELYPVLFVRALSDWFGDPSVRLVLAGDPGARVGEAANYLPTNVVAAQPDLVTVQLGGNDIGGNVNLFETQRSWLQVIDGIRAQTDAELLPILQPLEQKPNDGTFHRLLRDLGIRRNLSVADTDTAIKNLPMDHRGLYAQRGHPNEYEHAIMAGELLRAFQHRFGMKSPFSVRWEPAARVCSRGDVLSLAVTVRNVTGRLQTGRLKLCAGDAVALETALRLEPYEVRRISFEWRVPPAGRLPRTQRVLLWALAGSTSGASMAVSWASVAPMICCPALAPAQSAALCLAGEQGALGSLPAGPAGLALGREQIRWGWSQVAGDADLSARVAAWCDEVRLHLIVRVSDDVIVTHAQGDVWNNDCLELLFDLRPEAEQAAPYATPAVVVLRIIPRTPDNPKLEWNTMDGPPGGFRERIEVTGDSCEGGYWAHVALPLGLLEQWTYGTSHRIGFDLAVDDADTRLGRESWLMWAGSERDHFQPGLMGCLSWNPADKAGQVRVTVR